MRMRKLARNLILAGMLASPLANPMPGRDWRPLRKLSQACLILANSADIASSFQYPEANPILRDPRTGLLLHRGVAIKAGILAGWLIAQEWVGKGHPKATTIINFGGSAIVSGVAIRNFQIARRERKVSK